MNSHECHTRSHVNIEGICFSLLSTGNPQCFLESCNGKLLYTKRTWVTKNIYNCQAQKEKCLSRLCQKHRPRKLVITAWQIDRQSQKNQKNTITNDHAIQKQTKYYLNWNKCKAEQSPFLKADIYSRTYSALSVQQFLSLLLLLLLNQLGQFLFDNSVRIQLGQDSNALKRVSFKYPSWHPLPKKIKKTDQCMRKAPLGNAFKTLITQKFWSDSRF